MTQLHYREIICKERLDAEVLDEHQSFDLQKFAQVCGQNPEWVLQLLEYEILPERNEATLHVFYSDDIVRARRAYRLQRDFEASFAAVAMMMDLIDELQQLRKQTRYSSNER